VNYYINIQVLPSPEFSDTILMNELFNHLHKALVALGHGEIGVSFPDMNKTLGGLLRVHGYLSSLQRLMTKPWMGGLNDYIAVSEITIVPEGVSYRIVKRIQTKNSSERLIRRSVRKGWLTKEEATLKISDKGEKKLSLPYLRIKSHSTGKIFCLFVEHGPILSTPMSSTDTFTAYGLSPNKTIPWF